MLEMKIEVNMKGEEKIDDKSEEKRVYKIKIKIKREMRLKCTNTVRW